MDEIDDDFNTDAFKRAIAEIESSGGKNLSNKYSSAAGKYHFLYRHIRRDPLLKGVSKREFMANSDLQEQIMDKAIRGDLKGYASYKDGASKLKKEFGSELRTDQIAALTHFLGPTGTKKYLEDPENYKVSGKNNATVQQYIDRYDSYYQPKDGDSIFIEGKIKNNEVKYGTPEYKRLYDEGSIMGVSQDGTPFQNLDQVVVDGSEKYKTSKNEKVLDTNYIDSTLNANKDKQEDGQFKNGGWLDKHEEGGSVSKAQDGTEVEGYNPNSDYEVLYDIEKSVNKSLGDINNKARDFSYENGDENIDNMRHVSGGRYAAEAIQQKVRDIPYVGSLLDFAGVDKAAGFIGSNAMGIGHELSTFFGADERPFLAKLQEMGEDTFNNYVGSIVGSLGVDDSKKDEVIKYLSYNNLLPDGYVRTEQGKKDGLSENVYFKNEDNEVRRPEYKNGGWLDKYEDGGSVPKAQVRETLNEYQMGGNMTGDPVNGSLAEEGQLTEFEGGGTHEENPIGGIPQGLASNGKMNTVEEGESKYKFKKTGDYIFSNRIKL